MKSDFIFWFCALAGSGMFLIQLLIQIFGFGHQHEFATDDIAAHDAADVKNFKWFSMQTITGFLMVFGWSALSCQKEFNVATAPTIGISLATGVFAAFIIRSLFKLATKLKSSGTQFKIEEAIGKEGTIYQRIPKNGSGKVSISLQNFTHEIDAISLHPDALDSFTRVKIIEKKDDNTVVVTPLK